MNDDLMFDYLLQMGAMRPAQDELKRKQAMVDALRGNALKPMEGQMIGKHYVGPGLAGALSQLGQAYIANQQQGGVDAKLKEMNATQADKLLELRKLNELRKRRMGNGAVMDVQTPAAGVDPYAQFSYPNET